MNNIDLETEWATARRELMWADYKGLLASVDKRALAATYAEIGLGAGEITVQNGKFRRLFRGERAIILPVFGAAGYLTDLIAFRLSTPRSFWGFGAGGFAALGENEIERADFFGEPLQVYETPLQWLQAGRKGCCILNWTRCWSLYLSNVPALQFEDRDFAARATARMQRPLPVPPAMVRAAA